MKRHGYEFTERGNVAIAIILAVLMFVVPAIILTYRAWNGNGPYEADSPPQLSAVETETPEVVSTTPDSGENANQDSNDVDDNDANVPSTADSDDEYNDSEAVDSAQNDDADQNDNDTTGAQHEDTPRDIEMSLSDGTMLFWMSPSDQGPLEPDVISTLGDFMTSPRNTYYTQIIVEIPDLPESEIQPFVSSVINAFAEHSISRNNFSFAPYQVNETAGSFEVRLHFATSPSSLK